MTAGSPMLLGIGAVPSPQTLLEAKPSSLGEVVEGAGKLRGTELRVMGCKPPNILLMNKKIEVRVTPQVRGATDVLRKLG